jgi:hypothetical protein
LLNLQAVTAESWRATAVGVKEKISSSVLLGSGKHFDYLFFERKSNILILSFLLRQGSAFTGKTEHLHFIQR